MIAASASKCGRISSRYIAGPIVSAEMLLPEAQSSPGMFATMRQIWRLLSASAFSTRITSARQSYQSRKKRSSPTNRRQANWTGGIGRPGHDQAVLTQGAVDCQEAVDIGLVDRVAQDELEDRIVLRPLDEVLLRPQAAIARADDLLLAEDTDGSRIGREHGGVALVSDLARLDADLGAMDGVGLDAVEGRETEVVEASAVGAAGKHVNVAQEGDLVGHLAAQGGSARSRGVMEAMASPQTKSYPAGGRSAICAGHWCLRSAHSDGSLRAPLPFQQKRTEHGLRQFLSLVSVTSQDLLRLPCHHTSMEWPHAHPATVEHIARKVPMIGTDWGLAAPQLLLAGTAPLRRRRSPQHSLDLPDFEPISLAEMSDVALMRRTDTKYLMTEAQLGRALIRLTQDYRILEIAGRRHHRYQTLYFDTPDLSLFRQHHSGWRDRYKVRERAYADSGLVFLEVKHKVDAHTTHKRRVRTSELSAKLSDGLEPFLRTHYPYPVGGLQPTLLNTFQRITLVSKYSVERLTLDLGVHFWWDGTWVSLDGVAVGELKQDGFSSDSPFFRQMRSLGIASRTLQQVLHQHLAALPGREAQSLQAQATEDRKTDARGGLTFDRTH